ncbi:hypothetical protein ACFL6L_04545 [candidate division KSB1 bacterium]
MKIYNINGLQTPKDYIELNRKRKTTPAETKSDSVEISDEAKSKVSEQPLLSIISEYLEKGESIRDIRTKEVAQSIQDGYPFDREKLSIIAENILNNFEL